MKKFDLIAFLMNPKKWWLPLLIIFSVSIAGVMMIGIHTYTEAPPIPNFISLKKEVVYSKEDILKGQAVFQKYALMEYGSMFGDGANRGPDFTAEALHQTILLMNDYYLSVHKESDKNFALIKQGITEQVKKETKTNRYSAAGNSVSLSDAQVYAANELLSYYLRFFSGTSSSSFHPAGYIKNADEIRSLTAFFFWGAWVCGVDRPGETYSYTHNWPYDPAAGNTPTSAVIFWSIIGSLGLILGLGIVLYYHGKMEKLNDNIVVNKSNPFMTIEAIKRFLPTKIQKATYKFFYTAIVLFAVQVLAGILTVHDFVGFVRFFLRSCRTHSDPICRKYRKCVSVSVQLCPPEYAKAQKKVDRLSTCATSVRAVIRACRACSANGTSSSGIHPGRARPGSRYGRCDRGIRAVRAARSACACRPARPVPASRSRASAQGLRA